MSPRLQQLLKQSQQPPRLRACELCLHGRTTSGRRCVCPEFAQEPTREARALRAFGGACGPEAKHLAMPGVTTR